MISEIWDTIQSVDLSLGSLAWFIKQSGKSSNEGLPKKALVRIYIQGRFIDSQKRWWNKNLNNYSCQKKATHNWTICNTWQQERLLYSLHNGSGTLELSTLSGKKADGASETAYALALKLICPAGQMHCGRFDFVIHISPDGAVQSQDLWATEAAWRSF